MTATTLTPAEITAAFRALQVEDPTAALDLIATLLEDGWDDAPALWTDSYPDPDDDEMIVRHLVCPHCEQWPEEILAIDYALRQTETYVDDDAFDDEAVDFSYDGADCKGLTYRAGCCQGVVSLPEGWREA